MQPAKVTKLDLQTWLVDALKAHGGKATIVELCQHVWTQHEDELKSSGDLFYTWQYDIRWAATKLRQKGILAAADAAPKGTWILK